MRLFLSSTRPGYPTNTDIITGDFRLLDLRSEPLRLGEPIARIGDWIEGYPRRTLSL
jgi:hypothetical protein